MGEVSWLTHPARRTDLARSPHCTHAIMAGDLASPTASAQMLNLSDNQNVNDRIPALLPDGVSVAHKTGELPGVRDDGGIVTYRSPF